MESSSATSSNAKKIYKENHPGNLRTKILPKSELKSNIPKPVPYVRVKREPRSKSCSSACFKTTSSCFGNVNVRNPKFREKLSQNSCKSPLRAHSLPSTNSCRNQYSKIKPKIDNSTPLSLITKRNHLNGLLDHRRKGNSVVEEPPGDHKIKGNSLSSNKLEKKKHSLTSQYEFESYQPSLVPNAADGIRVFKKEGILSVLEEPKSCLFKESAPKLLSYFERQIERVSEMWRMLICDLIVTKPTVSEKATTLLPLHGSKMDWKSVIHKFLEELPTQGEQFQRQLFKIEEEQKKVIQVLIQDVVSLIKEHKELKINHCNLKETSEQNESRLKEELAILGQENTELDKKFISAIERIELEKSKTEEMEKNQMEILKKLFELRKVVKLIEKKFSELERRSENVETTRRKLEESVKKLETKDINETKKYEDLLKKHAESQNCVLKLKQQLKEGENTKLSLEKKLKEYENVMANKKAALENSLQERTQLEKKVADKDKKIKELIAEINLLQPKKTLCENKKLSDHKSNVELMKNLVSGADRRNVQIQEFRKKINRLEHMIRDKSNREEKLLSYATKLTKKCNNKCSSFNNQIKELQSSEKTLRNQVSELERVLGQKTLELHQRERLVKELKELIRLKNECEVSLWKCRKRDDNCKLLSEESTPSLKTIEVFNLLALKHMEIIKLDRRISGLQNIQNEDWKSGKEVIQANEAD